MVKFAFKKLVRDTIIDQQIASGAKPLYWQLSKEEHVQRLVQKIIEEVQEVAAAGKKDIASEIADVQQALHDLRNALDVSEEAVEEARIAKAAKNGGFEKGIYIEHVELPEDDAWVEYYRSNPDRYPEIA